MACSPYSRTTPHSPTRPPVHGPPRRDSYRTTSHAPTHPADTRTLARTWAAVSCLMDREPCGTASEGLARWVAQNAAYGWTDLSVEKGLKSEQRGLLVWMVLE